MSMQDPSHPQSTSARALCSDRESRVTMVVSNSIFVPFVPRMKRLEFLSSSMASIASVSPNRLMSSTVCWFTSIWRLGCDQMFNMETALSGSSLSRTATHWDVKGVNRGVLWLGSVYRFSSFHFASIGDDGETKSDWDWEEGIGTVEGGMDGGTVSAI